MHSTNFVYFCISSSSAAIVLRNGLNRAYCHVSARLKMPFLMFIVILVFCPEGQIWDPVRRDTKTYRRIILNASRIIKNH